MKFIWYFLILLIIVFACRRNDSSDKISFDEVSIKSKKDTFNLNSYREPIGGMGIKKGFDFHQGNKDSIFLYYYSYKADSFYKFLIADKTTLLEQKNFNRPDSLKTKVRGMNVISQDSIFIICKGNLLIYNYNDGKIVYHKNIPEKRLSVLANFTPPIYDKNRKTIYSEVLLWNSPVTEEGMLKSKMIYEFDLETGKARFPDIKVSDKHKKNSKYYFTLFDNKILMSYSNTKQIQVFDLEKRNLSKVNLESPMSLKKNVESKMKGELAQKNEELLRNSRFYELFSSDNKLYRIQSKPMAARTDKGLMPQIEDKKYILLEYNKNFKLERILKPDIKGWFPKYLTIIDNVLYALSYNPLVIYKFKLN